MVYHSNDENVKKVAEYVFLQNGGESVERNDRTKEKWHETQPSAEERQVQAEAAAEYRPFNDVTEHMQNVLGQRLRPADLSVMPLAARWFGYFFLTVMTAGVLMMLGMTIVGYFR